MYGQGADIVIYGIGQKSTNEWGTWYDIKII